MIDLTDFNRLISNPIVIRLVTILIGVAVILIVNGLIRKALNRTIQDAHRKYTARKAINMIAYIVVVVFVLMIYSDKLGNIGVALGVAGAGIAFALQEVIVSFAGWLTIMVSGMISVGQRVKIGQVKGDIIDIGVFRTTIMEIGDWVDGDLYNGRIVSLSNGYVYQEKVHNYSAEYPFLWDELSVPIRTTSDHKLAREIFETVLNEICGQYALESRHKWELMANKFRVESAKVEPMVTLSFNQNWITFTLRYVVDYKQRRGTKDKIYSRLLEEISKNTGKVDIASSAIEVTNML